MSYDVLEKKIDLLPVHYQQEVIDFADYSPAASFSAENLR